MLKDFKFINKFLFYKTLDNGFKKLFFITVL